ncbi:MAG: hypothetical protein ACRC7N_03260 [Clostridium sp.]
MFNIEYQSTITLENIPIQWIPKIELYYPDLPQFPIMYIHTFLETKRIIACPVSISYTIKNSMCDAEFIVLCNYEFTNEINLKIKSELKERVGLSNQISIDDIITCCNGNDNYINFMKDLWNYIQLSYGQTIPFGKLYEEIYSIVRFVSAWQPKTGRQSEMRMLYNFMSIFGEQVKFPNQWSHLEYYLIPNYQDVQDQNYIDFPIFSKLYSTINKIFHNEFSNSYSIDNVTFNVMPKAWKQNKNDFIEHVSKKLFDNGKLTLDEKFIAERLVDAFNRNSWRAAYFISSFMNINNFDYSNISKDFFKKLYSNGSKLKGYSEKVMACFLQQGFSNCEIIPIDTWIETFYKYPLNIQDSDTFYNTFNNLGKMERVIWLASQSNKTNMKNFFDILWCQRFGTIGNSTLREINPIACSKCKLKSSCIGLLNKLNSTILIKNNIDLNESISLSTEYENNCDFICILENNIPKKIYKKINGAWKLVDEFSGYVFSSSDNLTSSLICKNKITLSEFINNYN